MRRQRQMCIRDSNVHVALALRRKLMRHALRAVDERSVDRRVLMDRYRAAASIAGCDQFQPAASRCRVEMLLLIAWLDADDIRLDPDLQPVYEFALRWIEFAVLHALP